MPLTTVKFAAGVNAEVTQTQGIAQITSSQLIRFRYAGQETLPEKLGGWDKFYPLSMGSPVRALHAWEGINNDTHLAAGCTQSLNVITDGVGADITPRTATSNTTPSFTTVAGDDTITIDDPNFTPSVFGSIFLRTQVSVGGIVLYGSYQVISVLDSDTYQIRASQDAVSSVVTGGAVPEFASTAGSALITVSLDDHGYVVGQVFPVGVPTTVGGVTISGAYLVREVLDADTFTIILSNAASSIDTEFMNGGDARITYYVGIAPSAIGAGFGTSGYGAGGYGVGITPTPSGGTKITTTNWTLDNWGEVLIACPTNGPIYQWSPDSGFSTATKIVGAPDINGGAFVSQSAQVLIAWASSSTEGVVDPLSINWSTVGDYTVWTVTSQTQAGGYRIPTGSRIVGGMASPNFNLIWTDLDLWSMDYVGPPEVYGFNTLGSNCGLISRHAAVSQNSIVYWMGNNQFFLLNGERVQPIPCTVWDFVFQDLDLDNVDKIYAGSNSLFNEVTFYFPSLSGGTGEVDSYVKFNTALNVWDCGRLARSAWIDQSPVGRPVGGAPNGMLYQHEVSPDADGQPMVSWFETGYFAVSDGENLSFVDWIFPDFRYGYVAGDQDAILQMSLNFTDYPNGGNEKTKGPYSVSSATKYVNMRLRGRFVSTRFESQDLGSFWRLGGVKVRSVGDGKR